MPKISLCMIVRDEEENLDQCLPSIISYVDEAIIVDTGSTDRTREIATRYGANVYQFDQNNHPEAFFLDDEKSCKAFGAPAPYSGETALSDFGAARNESFRHATGEFIVWVDADDVVEHGEELRKIVVDMETRNVDMGFLAYDYARDHLGRVFYRQWRERIIRKGVANWISPVHEVLLPSRPVASARYEAITYSHRRKADRKSIPNRNYKILLKQLKEFHDRDPSASIDPRLLFYLGQEARFIEPGKSFGFYDEYLKRSGWAEERAAAHVAMGHLLEFNALGIPADEGYNRANREYATAAAEKPDNPDGLFGLARIAYLRGRYQDCVDYSDRGFSVGNTDSMLGANPVDRTYRPHVYYNDALWKLGRLDEAIASCKNALAVFPDDPGVMGGASGMLTHNLNFYTQEKQRRERPAPPAPVVDAQTAEGLAQGLQPGFVQFDKHEDVDAPPAPNIPRDAMIIWGMQLWKQCVQAGDAVRARGFLDSLPPLIALDPVIAKMRAATDRKFPKVVPIRRDEKESSGQPGSLSIVLWVGPWFEPWDPTTPNAIGIGGSETAAIEITKNLAALGHRVTVYGDCPHVDGQNFDGVTYRHYQQFAGVDCDVFISSRQPGIMDVAAKIKARLKLLWVHDINCGPSSPQMERWMLHFDRVLCLSEWHKGYFCSVYPNLHPDQVLVTRNGVDPARFSQSFLKENRMVWSSSPNRGLDLLLQNMPHIKRAIPDAQVDICYGFYNWETAAGHRKDPNELRDIQRYKDLIAAAEQRGEAKYHGRVNQTKLAELFGRSKVWGYLTQFAETSCISAMEAQAAGAVPVCSKYAALSETVKFGLLIDHGPDSGQKFVTSCIAMMRDEGARSRLADAGRSYALANFSWSGLAREWQLLFNRLIEKVSQQPLPLWRSG